MWGVEIVRNGKSRTAKIYGQPLRPRHYRSSWRSGGILGATRVYTAGAFLLSPNDLYYTDGEIEEGWDEFVCPAFYELPKWAIPVIVLRDGRYDLPRVSVDTVPPHPEQVRLNQFWSAYGIGLLFARNQRPTGRIAVNPIQLGVNAKLFTEYEATMWEAVYPHNPPRTRATVKAEWYGLRDRFEWPGSGVDDVLLAYDGHSQEVTAIGIVQLKPKLALDEKLRPTSLWSDDGKNIADQPSAVVLIGNAEAAVVRHQPAKYGAGFDLFHGITRLDSAADQKAWLTRELKQLVRYLGNFPYIPTNP